MSIFPMKANDGAHTAVVSVVVVSDYLSPTNEDEIRNPVNLRQKYDTEPMGPC